jgi:hypothetical protein
MDKSNGNYRLVKTNGSSSDTVVEAGLMQKGER